ncbi:MAG: hypothetical protein MH252_18665 [Thermosynechococcaceae cyanobacterium MS004]|nr:hypothetical protein [Thermosynechococcaceae cyanobacterium MS004]
MPNVLYQYLQHWCQEQGWTDLFIEHRQFWAFPPGSFMPVPVPRSAIERFYDKHTLSPQAKILSLAVLVLALGAIAWTALTLSPIPLLLGFACCAIAVGLQEPEYL